MSIVEENKLIILISALDELLSAWNVAASDASEHSIELRTESHEVLHLADKSKSRSLETEETDRENIDYSICETKDLLEEGYELLRSTEPLPQKALERVENCERACEISKNDLKKSTDWLNVATKELERALKEYGIALKDYENQLVRYQRALDKLNRTEHYIEETTSSGRRVTRINPAWESAKEEEEKQKAELNRRKTILDEKKANLNSAKKQKEYAMDAISLAKKMVSDSKILQEKSRDLQDWANSAYRSATYGVSAAKSALLFDEEADKRNNIQHEINKDTLQLINRIKVTLSSIFITINDIVDLTDSCFSLNVQFSTTLDEKRTILQKLATIVPDEIRILTFK